MRTPKKGPTIRPFLLHYMAGIFALLLACCSLLCIYWYTTPAHASPRSQQVVFDDNETPSPTVTTAPSPTATTAPSPTATSTFTPTPSPGATRTTPPSPTSTPIATGQPSPTAGAMQTPSPGARPTSSATSTSITIQGGGLNQTPVVSPTSAKTQGNQVSRGAYHPGNALPFTSLTLGLGSVILLGLSCIAGWAILRRRLLPRSSPRLPPSGAAPWRRTRTSEQVSLQDKMIESILSVAPSDGTSIAPGNNPPANWHILPTVADVPVPHQPAPSASDQAASRAAHARSPISIGHAFASPFLAARIKRRRNELRAVAGPSAIQQQAAGDLSAEITESSDPYLQSLIRLYNERGR